MDNMKYSKEWGQFIPPKSPINEAIEHYHDLIPEREQDCASPSTLTMCPRVVWLKKQGVPITNELGWGQKQRFMLGRITENTIASQLRDEGILLYHWKDDFKGESIKFKHGEGVNKLSGTPDLLLQFKSGIVAVSDAKTSRSDSFKYVPIESAEIWQDPYWYRYKLQVTAYYMLCKWCKHWFYLMDLPLPDICNLFSYALDNGVVMRDINWAPTKEDIREVIRLTKRWNEAYAAEFMPDCTCVEDSTVMFCPMGIKEGKTCKECCSSELEKEVNDELEPSEQS
jgi:hypothetical protein